MAPRRGDARAARDLAFPGNDDSGEEAGRDELEPGRQAALAVPAVEAVAREELAAARLWEAKDVLEIR